MRFFTKEWYELMQHTDDTMLLRKIPDREYSDDDIAALYKKEEKRFIVSERRDYNRPPILLTDVLDLTSMPFDPEDWLDIDEKTGEAIRPESMEQVKTWIEAEYERAMDDFEKMAPFDADQCAREFRRIYREKLRSIHFRYPAWVSEQVDKRLLALDLMPESQYKRLRAESTANKRRFKAINKAAAKTLSHQDIPEHIRERFWFHDANVLEIKKTKKSCKLLLNNDIGIVGEGATPYVKILFKDVKDIYREKGLMLYKRREPNGELCSNCYYLYDELYRDGDGYEVHMLMLSSGELKYLTVRCKDIIVFENVTP